MKKIILSFLVCLSFSCKHKPDANTIDHGIEKDTATVNKVPENTEDFSIKFKSLEIKQFEKKFLKSYFLNEIDKETNTNVEGKAEEFVEYVGDKPFFCTTLVIQNNTPNKITSFELTYILKAIYADGKTEYWPSHSEESEESMLDNQYLNKFVSVKQKDIWNPNEIKEYN
ncbi:MAG TPA: hypothetical protein DCM02_11115, partial [Flavobacterium sp.]|nr:hypothetical protein [Flavobacterium sp.]